MSQSGDSQREEQSAATQELIDLYERGELSDAVSSGEILDHEPIANDDDVVAFIESGGMSLLLESSGFEATVEMGVLDTLLHHGRFESIINDPDLDERDVRILSLLMGAGAELSTAEILEHTDIGARETVFRRVKKLCENGYATTRKVQNRRLWAIDWDLYDGEVLTRERDDSRPSITNRQLSDGDYKYPPRLYIEAFQKLGDELDHIGTSDIKDELDIKSRNTVYKRLNALRKDGILTASRIANSNVLTWSLAEGVEDMDPDEIQEEFLDSGRDPNTPKGSGDRDEPHSRARYKHDPEEYLNPLQEGPKTTNEIQETIGADVYTTVYNGLTRMRDKDIVEKGTYDEGEGNTSILWSIHSRLEGMSTEEIVAQEYDFKDERDAAQTAAPDGGAATNDD